MQLTAKEILPIRKGRAAWLSPFFVACAALCLLAAAVLPGNAYRWSSLVLLTLAGFSATAKSLPANGLSAAVVALSAWLFAGAVVVAPSYSADALYRPFILVAGFAVGANLDATMRQRLFRVGILLLAVLVLIGLLQTFTGFWHLAINPQRAAATFITPNTFATAINLLLLPLLALVGAGRAGWPALAAALWLYAGLLATESRGGWVALAAGLGFIGLHLAGRGSGARRMELGRILAAMALVTLLFFAMVRFLPTISWHGSSSAGEGLDSFGETVISRGASHRLAIYEVAARLVPDHPFIGYGADMFRFLYERTKPLDLDTGHPFLFVHNDYLQFLVEFGAIGLGLLLFVVALAFAATVRARRIVPDDVLPLACGAALTGIFVHALVDFPLYVHFPLLLASLWLGTLAGSIGSEAHVGRLFAATGRFLEPVRTPLVAASVLVAALAWTAQPTLADAASGRALSALFSGRADQALYWQSVARRLEPRNGAHYWVEGTILRDQAVAAGDKALAAKADMLFAAGMQADPYQIANFLERARTRRLYPGLFGHRSETEVLAWTDQALRLRPYSLLAQAERARGLEYAGRSEAARQIVSAMIARHPTADVAGRLAAEFGLPATGSPR